ncbi:hypothetical protein SAMN06265365_11068 [Tistlia consotensis]|uniref:Uncharacterized protein n=2 Tax=Tistlia TaxID=1321364 RepID=A0A1Y6BSW8_9PROT|nr:hypothetical protein SAMN05428998_10988 [Tistlia consotensis USBA 355]SNR66078.1 hypothetical protein SAMN06265365_11068 [Tistlia consotensis]
MAANDAADRPSRAILHDIHEAEFFAFVHNAVGVSTAAGLVYPLFGIPPSLVIAAQRMSLRSIPVIPDTLHGGRLHLGSLAPAR